MTPEEKLDQIATVWETLTGKSFTHNLESKHIKDLWVNFVKKYKPTRDEIAESIEVFIEKHGGKKAQIGLLDLEFALKTVRRETYRQKKRIEEENQKKKSRLQEKTLKQALSDGTIQKPNRCSVCGSTNLHYTFDPKNILKGKWSCLNCMLDK